MARPRARRADHRRLDGGVPRRGHGAVPPEAVLIDPRFLIVLAGVGFVAWQQGDAGEANALRRRHDFRYPPDPRVVRVVAGAHRSTTADLIWLRTLPDLYRDFADVDAKARWIDGSLEAVTNLEPSFMTVYDFGQAYFTTRGRTKKGAVDRAIALLEKGIRLNPGVSGLRVRLAMVHYMERQDAEKAREILEEAATLPGFDFLSAQMLSSLRSAVHQDLIDITWWLDLMESGPPDGRPLAELNLWRSKARIAARAAREFAEKTGRKPSSPADLATPEYVQAEVVQVIAEGLEIDAEGRPVYPRLDEMERDDAVRAAEAWCRTFRDEKGRWPEIEDFEAVGFRLPPPPEGKRWTVDGGRVELVPE